MITTNEFFFFRWKRQGLGEVILGSNSPPRRLRLGVWRGGGEGEEAQEGLALKIRPQTNI